MAKRKTAQKQTKSSEDLRTHQINIRVTPAEAAKITDMMMDSGFSTRGLMLRALGLYASSDVYPKDVQLYKALNVNPSAEGDEEALIEALRLMPSEAREKMLATVFGPDWRD